MPETVPFDATNPHHYLKFVIDEWRNVKKEFGENLEFTVELIDALDEAEAYMNLRTDRITRQANLVEFDMVIPETTDVEREELPWYMADWKTKIFFDGKQVTDHIELVVA